MPPRTPQSAPPLSPPQFLAALVDAYAPSGSEAGAVALWRRYLAGAADESSSDAYGNGVALLNPAGDPRIVITGHADEIGLMASYIDDEGFIWVAGIGGYDAKILPAMRVRIAASGPDADGGPGGPPHWLPGVVGALPPHMQNVEAGGVELKRYRFGENVYVDIGAKDKAHAERYVRVGDSMVLDYGYAELRRELAVGRGLDNKAGIWAAAEVLWRCAARRAAGEALAASVIALATVQEEIGGYGAAMAAYSLNPDCAVAIDVTQAVDHPGSEKKRFGEVKLGRGPVLAHGSACHPQLTARIEQAAADAGIELQHEAAPRATGTDGDNIFRARAGIPTAVLGLPQRYMHSPVELIHQGDLDQLAELLVALCFSLTPGERFKVQV